MPINNKIAIVGAFSRYNYGDILMPIVVREMLGRRNGHLALEFYSYRNSDLSEIGGIPSKSLSNLYIDLAKGKFDWIVVAGGQVLGQEHRRMLPLELKTKGATKSLITQTGFKAFGKIAPGLINTICRRVAGIQATFPWIIEGEESAARTIYNTVGGNYGYSNSLNRRASRLLALSPYFTVRSRSDFEIWKDTGVECKLVPDSVACISHVFRAGNLSNLVRKEIRSQISSIGDYFIFQISRENAFRREAEIAQYIQKSVTATGLQCLLVPMGYAAGHEDDTALRNIAKYCDHRVHLLDNASVHEITYAISRADAYLGTSLHGAIVSSSYGVPHTTICAPNKKTQEYLESWKSTRLFSTNLNDLPSAAKYLVNDNENRKYTEIRSIEIINQVEQHFDLMAKIITSDH